MVHAIGSSSTAVAIGLAASLIYQCGRLHATERSGYVLDRQIAAVVNRQVGIAEGERRSYVKLKKRWDDLIVEQEKFDAIKTKGQRKDDQIPNVGSHTSGLVRAGVYRPGKSEAETELP